MYSHPYTGFLIDKLKYLISLSFTVTYCDYTASGRYEYGMSTSDIRDRVHMNVVPRSTMNTNGGTEN